MSDILLVLLVFCAVSVYTQSFSGVRPFTYNGYIPESNSRKQLSPQQQGQILSDIQQHQNRYQQHHQSIVKNQARPQKQPDIVRNAHPISSKANFHQASFLPPYSNLDNLLNKPTTLPEDNKNVLPRHNQQNKLSNNFVNRNPEQTIDPKLTFNNQGRQLTNGQPIANSFSRQLSEPTNLPFLDQQSSINNFNSQPLVNSAQTLLNNPLLARQISFNGNNVQAAQAINNPNVNQFQTQSSGQQPTVQPTQHTNTNPANPIFATDQSVRLNNYFDSEKHQQQLKELQLKQQIIDKHNQFVEKQYEKALNKAQSDHKEWLSKQVEHKETIYQSLATIENPTLYNYTHLRSRYVHSKELPLFQKALEKYFEEHPTTTTTTTTEAPSTTISPKNIFEKFKQQLLLANKEQKLVDSPPIITTDFKTATEATKYIPKQATAKLNTFLPTVLPELKSEATNHPEKPTLLHLNNLFQQQKLIISDTPEFETVKNFTSREISLANLQNITLSDQKLLLSTAPFSSLELDNKTLNELQLSVLQSTTTIRPPKAILEELTKGVLPPGANFEVIKHNQNGGLEELEKLPANLSSQKKVTFVLLEEQQDGSFKVQGVKGNTDQKDNDSDNVDAILQRIKDGEIKLPPSSKTSSSEVTTSPIISDIETQSTVFGSNVYNRNWVSVKTNDNSSNTDTTTQIPPTTQTPVRSTNGQYITTQSIYSTKAPLPSTYYPSSTERYRSPTIQNTVYPSTLTTAFIPKLTTETPQRSYSGLQNQSPHIPTILNATAESYKAVLTLIDVLKKQELYAMAKFLKQSGLDTILNETGPYTIFVPTDQAFRLMLIQLGGPGKAEEKFKENPRLLSGLLLHHIIPGTFEISSLQDEMTGVSLAGTQLRVNQYTLQDVEWNEIKVTTINGAKVIPEKQDIAISQGIVHAIDRVMFPLPVGDIVQTLQSDREKRFTNFLKIFFTSGLMETLQESKTFTLFVPVDRAFSKMGNEELNRLSTDKRLAKKFVMKHIAPGTLYTSGMSYYHIMDSLLPEQQITINKDSDRVKVNNIPMLTRNIPATNGVIHAISSTL